MSFALHCASVISVSVPVHHPSRDVLSVNFIPSRSDQKLSKAESYNPHFSEKPVCIKFPILIKANGRIHSMSAPQFDLELLGYQSDKRTLANARFGS